MGKTPRLLVAATVVALALWVRLLYGLLSNAPPAKRFAYFDEKGQAIEQQSCRGPMVLDGSRLWMLCGSGQNRIGRFDLETGRADLTAPVEANGFFAGFLRVGEDAYLLVQTSYAHVYRVGGDGRVEDLGHVDETCNGIGWTGDHLELVGGHVLPSVYARRGNEWKPRPITYRDNDYVGRSFALAYRESAGWKFVVTRFPRSGPAEAPLKIDVELGDESGHWETVQQLEVPAKFAVHLSDGTIQPRFNPFVERSAGGLLSWSFESDLPYTFTNGRFEPPKPPVTNTLWRGDGSREGNRLVSIPQSTVRDPIARVRDRWIAIENDRGAVLHELPAGRRSPRAIAPMSGNFSPLPQGNGYLLVSAFDGRYARVGEDLRRADPPNMFLRLQLLDATWWQKLVLAVVLFAPIGLFLARRSRQIEPLSLGYLGVALIGAIWVLPMLARI